MEKTCESKGIQQRGQKCDCIGLLWFAVVRNPWLNFVLGITFSMLAMERLGRVDGSVYMLGSS
jgi:hypothetical protein